MDAKKINLSILIPAYNAEKYIGRCLDSILNQQKELALQVIIINDGSTDETVKIIEQYKQQHTNIQFFSIPNRGVYKARNYGLKKMTGRYFWMLDADDYLNENVVDEIASIIYNSKESVDIFHLGYQQQKPDKSWQLKVPNGEHLELIDGFEFLKRSDGRLFLWNNIYRADFLKENDIQFLAQSVSLEDSLFNIEAFAKAKIVKVLDVNAYAYCYNANSISKKPSPKHLKSKGIASYTVHTHIKEIRDSYPIGSEKYNVINHRLNHSVLGFFFSLYKDGYSANYANEMLKTYHESKLLPIQPPPDSSRLRLFAYMITHRWPFIILKMIKKPKCLYTSYFI